MNAQGRPGATPPRLSVVMATRNRPSMAIRALESALAQDFGDLEILVVDDASDPASARELDRGLAALRRRIEGEVPIRLLRNERNLGPADARNRAVAEARGELIAIMDDDDVSRPDRFSEQIAALDRSPGAEAVFSATRWVDGDGQVLALWPGVVARGELPTEPRALFRLLYVEGNKLPNPTLLARASLLRRMPYPSELRVGEDWFAFLQWAASGVGIVALSEPLVDMRRGDDHASLMTDKKRAFADQLRLLRQIRAWSDAKELGLPASLHRRAWASELVRQGRWYSGLRGLRKVGQALAHAPTHGPAWRALGELLRKAGRKLGRLGSAAGLAWALASAWLLATPAEGDARSRARGAGPAAPPSCPLPDAEANRPAGRPVPAGVDRPDIVLIAVDTLRADHLGFLGYGRSTSPNLDRLAADGWVFEHAIAPAPWTTPSFAGLFTGRYPAEIGIGREPVLLPSEVPTLAEELDRLGYLSAGIVSHFFLGTKFGFDRGFDFWNQDAAGGHDLVSSEAVTDLALACLERMAERDEPFLLFAHYFDPHYDYLGHDEYPFHAGYVGTVESRRDNFEDLRRMARNERLSPRDLRHLRDLYDSEIAFTDHHVGRLLDALVAAERYDDALVVFVADHGEMFAERRGRWIGHTRYLFEELVRVPLVIKLPALPAGGARRGRISTTVSLVDLAPTLLHQVGAPGATPLRSLLSAVGRTRPVFSQTRRWNQLDALYHDGYKLIADRRNRRNALYRLATDPGEEKDLASEQPERAEAMFEMVEAWQAYNRRERAKLRGVEVPTLTAEELETLKSLGYIQ